MLKATLFYILLGLSSVAAATESSPVQQVTQYQTDVFFNNEANELKVDTNFVIPVANLQNNTASLFLNKEFEIANITGDTLDDYTLSVSERVPAWNIIKLQFSGDEPAHEINITYSGAINAEDGHGNHITSQSIHLSIDSAWHPIFSDFSTPIQGTLKADLAPDWKLYGPGRVEQDNEIHHLISNEKTIDVSLFAAPSGSEVVENNFAVVHDPQNRARAGQLAEMGNDCLTALNQQFAAGTPLESAVLVLLERSGPSFARSNYLSVNADVLANEEQSYQYICHELSHHWTAYGDVMSHHYWMVESFAEYVAAQQVKSKFGAEAYDAIIKHWQNQAKGHDFVWRAEVQERASAMVNYALGPLLLLQLEQRIGESTFNQLLDYYMTTSVTETEALLSELERLSTTDTRQWFEQRLGNRE